MEIYKNRNRITLIEGDKFIEVNQLKTVISFKCGTNKFIVDDARSYDQKVTGNDVKEIMQGVLDASEELINDLKKDIDDLK